jgi:hypothetical protein
MTPPILPDRHTVYLTNTAWKKLKERAILEDSSATSIVAYLLEAFLNAPAKYLPLTRYQARLAEDLTEQRKRRTIYVPDRIWEQVAGFCDEQKISISGVIEYLLMQYLGLLPEEKLGKSPEPARTRESPGHIEFDMGDNPFRINLTPDKPDRP